LHANITEKMVRHATALFVCDYYPHTDMYETGIRAAACMYRTLAGEVRPVMAWKKIPMVIACTSTLDGTMHYLTRQAQEMRKLPGVLGCNLVHGFFWSNLYEQGMAALAITDGDALRAKDLAENLAEQVWDAREELKYAPLDADSAIDAALKSDSFPVILADAADNPGGGGTGDAVYFLKRLLERDVQGAVMGAIYDPETTEQAVRAGVGATIRSRIGGKVMPHITGGPVECDAYVRAITDGKYPNSGPLFHGVITNHGKIAVLQVGGVTVLVSTIRAQAWDLELYRSCGIMPERQKIIVPKSAVHYRASYSEVSRVMLTVETPAAASQKLENFNLDRCKRPMYPLDEEVTL
jgi:microcystin degradation protein MlrC